MVTQRITDSQRKKMELLELRKQMKEKLHLCFDAEDLKSRPTPPQLEILKSKFNVNFIIAGNRSGKTQTGARAVSYFFNGDHPYIPNKKNWPKSGLQIIVMGQTRTQLDNEIWGKKMRAFCGIEGKDYKITRSGNFIISIRNLHNNNVMLFMTHSDAEQARARGQGFTAQVVWVDEMPSRSSIVTELIMRTLTDEGICYFTFTPLIKNQAIKKIVDTPGDNKKKFTLSVVDNPKLTEKQKEEIVEYFRSISSSEAEFQARLNGTWVDDGLRVYAFDPERNLIQLEKYQPDLWPHMVVVDPAHSGMVGLGLFTKIPHKEDWVMVVGKYLTGKAPSDLVEEVEREIEGFNVIHRICDCNPAGFYKEAAKMGIDYTPVFEKQNNKENWVDDTNQAYKDKWLYILDSDRTLHAVEEMASCSRDENDPTKIVKASKYHLADVIRYFIVMKPNLPTPDLPTCMGNAIKKSWKKVQEEERKENAVQQLKIEHKLERRTHRLERRAIRRGRHY